MAIFLWTFFETTKNCQNDKLQGSLESNPNNSSRNQFWSLPLCKLTSGQWCSGSLSPVCYHISIQRDLNPDFKVLLTKAIEAAYPKRYKRFTHENDPYCGYCNNFLIGLIVPEFLFKKTVCYITFLIKMSLYYPITNKIKFKLLTLAFKVLQYLGNTHPLQPNWMFNM